jgi:hypothetical protein
MEPAVLFDRSDPVMSKLVTFAAETAASRGRWSIRRSLAFMVGANLALWVILGAGLYLIL